MKNPYIALVILMASATLLMLGVSFVNIYLPEKYSWLFSITNSIVVCLILCGIIKVLGIDWRKLFNELTK